GEVKDSIQVRGGGASGTGRGGETCDPYKPSAGTFTLGGSSAGNYSGASFAGSPTWAINQARPTASIANQSKTYGADDPSLAGITPALAGVVNTTVTDWNGNSTAINDTGKVAGNLQSLTRNAGETVGSY